NVASLANGLAASYVLGQASFTTGSSSVSATGLDSPGAVAFDGASGLLYVSDGLANRIMVFNASAISSGMSASYVLGQPSFTSSTGATSQTGLRGPLGLSVDSANHRLFVVDENNNRV